MNAYEISQIDLLADSFVLSCGGIRKNTLVYDRNKCHQLTQPEKQKKNKIKLTTKFEKKSLHLELMDPFFFWFGHHHHNIRASYVTTEKKISFKL